ncbi:toxin-antitoxin system YwqK family antitoxin [Pseudotenacibaculum sp. MALMAid0570]|uniref:toxin-antitoxin system YwqK family antitoxin n=1 Tax=Pseudotenacibaculum sp. MALMAid0570 TaxID=3143938 RepID=UPI0032DFCCA1
MLKIKRLFSLLLLFSVFFGLQKIEAQKINQFNKNKKRTGIWKKYYPNKRVRYVGRFVNGKEVGTFKYYDISTSKHPTIIKEFSAASDSAYVKFYTLKGKLRSKGYMIGKKRVGKWDYYFSNGKIFSEEFYVDGKLEGEVKDYYPNGKVLEHTQYQNGLKNGFSKKYSDKGILIEEVNYVNDVLNGPGKYYELNGDLKEEGIYRNGKRHGKWEFYIGGKKVTRKEKRKENKFNKKDIKKQEEKNENN